LTTRAQDQASIPVCLAKFSDGEGNEKEGHQLQLAFDLSSARVKEINVDKRVLADSFYR
jgi:hypothetical protein